MIPEVYLFTNVHEIKSQKIFELEDSEAPFEPHFWLPSHQNLWIVSRHCLKYQHLATLLIKTNAQLHLKMLSCNFCFLKMLTDFRHKFFGLRENWIRNYFKVGLLQIKWLHFYFSNLSFLPDPIFLLLSFIFNSVNILGTHNLQKEDW